MDNKSKKKMHLLKFLQFMIFCSFGAKFTLIL